jgi:hypothetical protein
VLCTTIAQRVQKLLERRAIEHDEPDERALCFALCRSFTFASSARRTIPSASSSRRSGPPDRRGQLASVPKTMSSAPSIERRTSARVST